MLEDDHAAAGGELAAVERLRFLLGRPPEGEVWIGDDAAVLGGSSGPLLLASDALVEGVHFTRTWSTLADVGWKALVVNVSDLAAMGGRPLAAVVALCGATSGEVDTFYEGITEASAATSCPVVGGDLSDAALLVVTVSVLGTTDGRPPTLRSGGRPGDRLYVTAPLGVSAAGLRRLREDAGATGELVERHRRPRPRLAEGLLANELGATAMLDLSDGLAIDVDRLARASGVGVELSRLPVHPGAEEAEALSGGEDYELLFSLPPDVDPARAFAERDLPAPIEVGVLVEEATRRTLRGSPFESAGYVHGLGEP